MAEYGSKISVPCYRFDAGDLPLRKMAMKMGKMKTRLPKRVRRTVRSRLGDDASPTKRMN